MSNITKPQATKANPISALMVRTGASLCALPASDVLEIMRPLPIQPWVDLPAFVLGLAVIRGGPVLVVDLGCVLGVESATSITRFVTVRVDDRKLALAVEAIIGVRRLDGSLLERVPPLLEGASREFIEAIGVQDEGLLIMLRTARIIPREIWQTLELNGTNS